MLRWFIVSTSGCCHELPEVRDDYRCGYYLGLNLGNSDAISMKLYSWN